jgi:hypothetical protein
MVDNRYSRVFCFNLYIHSGLPYDIGYGQKLFLRCRGHGVPTGISMKTFRKCRKAFCVVILDAPTGMNSDIWLPLQESLQTKTTVNEILFRFRF